MTLIWINTSANIRKEKTQLLGTQGGGPSHLTSNSHGGPRRASQGDAGRQVVRTPGLCKESTATFLDPQSGEPSTSRSWDAGVAPGLSRLHGHVFTRNMEDVAACMHAFDTGVLRQNMKNATVPPWRGFCQGLQKSLRQLTSALPDSRVATAASLLQSLTAVCRSAYDRSYEQYPPLLHERYIRA